MSAKQKGVKEITANRKAFHEYFVLERFEAGIELAGTEVKSIRGGNVNLKDAFCTIKNGELFIRGMHISPYEHGNIFNKDPVRPRRLLMHKREILKLNARVMQDGVALIRILILEEKQRGALILLASHNKEDIGLLADRLFRIEMGVVFEQEWKNEE